MKSNHTFDYHPKLWQSCSMEPESCNHTFYHVAEDGYLDGSWTHDAAALADT